MAANQATEGADVERVSARRAKVITELFDPDLEWFLVAGAAAMRERGTLGAIVNALELGGHGSGVPNTDLYTDAQVGWGGNATGEVERFRWLQAAWFKLTPEHQVTLLACYLPPRSMYRSDEGYGARDKFVEGSFRPGSHDATRTGVEAQLGELAGLAFHLTAEPQKLLKACQDPRNGGNVKRIRKAHRDAKEAAVAAHWHWQEAKTGKPRRRRDRVAALPRHDPSEATP